MFIFCLVYVKHVVLQKNKSSLKQL